MRTSETGLAYNASARDGEAPPPGERRPIPTINIPPPAPQPEDSPPEDEGE